jgi:hypothetical protein
MAAQANIKALLSVIKKKLGVKEGGVKKWLADNGYSASDNTVKQILLSIGGNPGVQSYTIFNEHLNSLMKFMNFEGRVIIKQRDVQEFARIKYGY